MKIDESLIKELLLNGKYEEARVVAFKMGLGRSNPIIIELDKYQARYFIQKGKYAIARKILLASTWQKSKEWLQRIDEKAIKMPPWRPNKLCNYCKGYGETANIIYEYDEELPETLKPTNDKIALYRLNNYNKISIPGADVYLRQKAEQESKANRDTRAAWRLIWEREHLVKIQYKSSRCKRCSGKGYELTSKPLVNVLETLFSLSVLLLMLSAPLLGYFMGSMSSYELLCCYPPYILFLAYIAIAEKKKYSTIMGIRVRK